MKFNTLEGMFYRYHEVRAGLAAARTNMPDSDRLRVDVQMDAPHKKSDVILNRQAFVADVSNYLKRLECHESYILANRMLPKDERLSYAKIVKGLKDFDRPMPGYCRNRNNLREYYYNFIRPAAESYFQRIGYIR